MSKCPNGTVLWLVAIAASALITVIHCDLQLKYQWKEIDFQYPTLEEHRNAIDNQTFIPQNVIPVGLEVYENRLFVTLPRWKNGVPASLAYINLNDTTTISPNLIPYPSWGAHRSLNADEAPEIVSPFRIKADRCGRLWVLDTGVEDILNATETKQLAATQLLVYDLRNDNLIRRFELPTDQRTDGKSFFANIAVEDDDCDNAFAYLADLGAPGLVVYSWKTQESWRVQHHYFHPDPLQGNYSINGIQFQWPDGLFGVALSGKQDDGFATLYFHPLSSINEFAVSTKVLRNQTLATSQEIYRDFKLIGSRGVNGQSGATFLDKSTDVIFYTLPNRNEIACWRTTSSANYSIDNGNVFTSAIDMVFPNDVKVDSENRLWVLSDNLQQFVYGQLDPTAVNFRILSAPVKEAVRGTDCASPTLLKEIIPNNVHNIGEHDQMTTTHKSRNTGTTTTPFVYTTAIACSMAMMVAKYF